jgi:ABC-type polysaccharide/polyol phosphate transport system ATPase subunit
MASIIFEKVSLQYPIYHNRAMSLRNQLVRLGTGGRIESDAGHVNLVTALKDVSFELRDGDAVGLIGHNGSGKTTLLRAMAGVYGPTSGQITREGSLATVFELGAGLEPELSGYDNILRMSLLMGMSLPRAKENISGIETFTELGDFLQLPVRTYSSGMTMRLMFAVATAVEPEILLIDEMFGTGDAQFQEKARARLSGLIDSSNIFVFASHSQELLKRYCNRLFNLDHGNLTEIEL